MSQRPYRVAMPRSFMALIVSISAGSRGGSSSTSTVAEARFQGPRSVYEAPYSAVVTWALDLRTE